MTMSQKFVTLAAPLAMLSPNTNAATVTGVNIRISGDVISRGEDPLVYDTFSLNANLSSDMIVSEVNGISTSSLNIGTNSFNAIVSGSEATPLPSTIYLRNLSEELDQEFFKDHATLNFDITDSRYESFTLRLNAPNDTVQDVTIQSFIDNVDEYTPVSGYFNFAGGGDAFLRIDEFTVNQIPESSTTLTAGLSALALAARRRRTDGPAPQNV